MPDIGIAANAVAPVRNAVPTTIVKGSGVLGVREMHMKMLALQISNAPILSAAPTQVDVVANGTDGKKYFVPTVTVSTRSPKSNVPHVFIDHEKDANRGDVYTLKVTFDVKR